MPTATGSSSLVHGFQTELELLQRHIRMLQFVAQHGPIGIIRLASLLGVPKHKVRYSLRILEKEGFIRPSTAGAQVTEKVATFFDDTKALLVDVRRQLEELSNSLQRQA